MAEQKTQGTKLWVYSAADAYVEVDGITGISGPGGQASEIDATDLASTAVEVVPGLIDNGSLSVDAKFNPDDEGQARLISLHGAQTIEQFKLEYPDGKYQTFQGYVMARPETSQYNQFVTVQYSVRISGPITTSW